MISSSYRNYRDWKQWNVKRFGQVDKKSTIYFQSEFNKLGFSQLLDVRVVELGFGNGAFATWANSCGARYTGIEIIPELVHAAQNVGINAELAGSPLTELFGEEKVDLVVAFDVLEHISLDKLFETLDDCRKCLRQDGQLIARVPSGDSPFSRAIQHGDLTHETIFGSSLIKQLAVEIGYSVKVIRSPAFPLLGLGFSTFLRRSLVSSARALAYPIIANVFM